MILAADIVAEARTWCGVPFLHQGRSRFGVDCVGLVLCVRQALGPLPEAADAPTNYPRVSGDAILLERMSASCEERETAEAGGIILMIWPGMKHPTHVAICTGDTIVHAYARQKEVLEVGYRAQWVRWTHSFWRLPGVAYE